MREHRANIQSANPARSAGPGRAATRLLAALGEAGAEAIPDPTREGFVIVRVRRGAVSLGRGGFPETALRELARHDLAALVPPGAFRSATLTEPGRARLRREGAEPFAEQHRETEAARDADGAPIRLNAAESPLDWMRRRKDRDGAPLLDAASYEAGERLRRDLTLGGLLPSVTARWDGAIGSGGPRDPAAAADATIAARQRARAAMAAIGAEFADLLVDLCGFLKGLETIERDRGWPPRSAKIVIRLALGRLAAHYGLETEARGPERGRVRTWQDEAEGAARGGRG